MKYYRVLVKKAHCGRNKYILDTIPVTATSASEASRIARDCPRVKHDHKDAIRCVTEISFAQYTQELIAYKNNPYNQCKSIQEQRRLCPDLYEELIEEEEQFKKDWRHQKDCDKPYNKKKANKFGYKNGKQVHPKRLNLCEYDAYDYVA